MSSAEAERANYLGKTNCYDSFGDDDDGADEIVNLEGQGGDLHYIHFRLSR